MGKLQLLGVCSHPCKIRMVTLAYGGHCRLLTQSHPTVCGLPPLHCQAHPLPLSLTYTFIVHQSLSLTLEAPNIRALLSQPSFSQIKVWWSSSGHSNWGKCHNIFWERLPTPHQIYSWTKTLTSLLSVVICNCLSHLTVREGTLHRVWQNEKIDSLNLWQHHHPAELFYLESYIWSVFKSVLVGYSKTCSWNDYTILY